MKVVSQKTIQRTLKQLDKMREKEVEALIKAFTDEQPVIMAYLMAQEEEFAESDFDNAIDLTLLLFLAFKNECGKLRELSIDEIENIHEKHIDRLERLDKLTEAELEAEMMTSIDKAKQPFLLELMTEELVSMEESGSMEDEGGAAALFSLIQLMIDFLDAAANGSFLRIV